MQSHQTSTKQILRIDREYSKKHEFRIVNPSDPLSAFVSNPKRFCCLNAYHHDESLKLLIYHIDSKFHNTQLLKHKKYDHMLKRHNSQATVCQGSVLHNIELKHRRNVLCVHSALICSSGKTLKLLRSVIFRILIHAIVRFRTPAPKQLDVHFVFGAADHTTNGKHSR